MITQIKNFLKGKATYSRLSARVIITLLLMLLAFYLFKDVINMPTKINSLFAGLAIFIIILNTVIIYPPKKNWQKILQDFILVLIFLTIAFFLIFNIFSLHEANLIGTESKITYTSIGSGLIAIFGLLFIYQRLEKQQKQIDIQIDQRVDDRFNSAIGLLGSSETSARTGAIYTLYELAIEEDKYRSQIAQILCSHIRSKTNEKKYQKTHSKRPSSEIQTTIDLLFRKKGLYTKKFARAAEFPKANLSHAYLMGAVFTNAWCQKANFEGVNFSSTQCQKANFEGADFSSAQCQKADFSNAQCQGADFTDAQCQETDFLGAQCEGAFFAGAQCQGADFTIAQCRRVDFSNAQCHGAKFNGAQCQEADFLNSEFQGVNFILANFENTNFENTKCQGADFSDAKFYKETRLQSGGEINDEAIKAIKDAKPYLDNSWYEKMKKIIKENEGKDPEFKTYPFT